MPEPDNSPIKATKLKIRAVYEGFPLVITVHNRNVADVLTHLKASGCTPPPVLPATVPAAAAPPASDAPPPKCPTHKRIMKPSRKRGEFFCPAKEGNDYCDYKIQR